MEKNIKHKITGLILPSPRTNRGLPSTIDISKNRLLYFNSCCVFIKYIHNQNIPLVINHVYDVTAAAWSAHGRYVASGDQKGNILVTEVLQERIINYKTFQGCLGGVVRSIDWTGDHNKIVVAGQGKSLYARVINIDTGTNVGEIVGVANTITTVGFRPQRPYKLVVAGQEKAIKFFEGPPYKFVKSQGSHTNVINQIRYDRKGQNFLSVSTDRKIVIYQGKTSNIIKYKEKCHQAGIMGVDWFISGNNFATASNDKSIKIWNKQLQQLKTLSIRTNQGTKIEDFQVAIRTNGDDIYSVSLNGSINYWQSPLTSNNNLPTKIISSYTGKPLRLIKGKNTFYTFDTSGKVLFFDKNERILKKFETIMNLESKLILDGALSGCGTYLYILHADQTVRVYDTQTTTFKQQISVDGSYGLISVSANNRDHYLLLGNQIVLYNNKNKCKSIKIDYDATSVVWSHEGYIAVGTLKGQINIYNDDLSNLIQTITHNTSCKITVLRVSENLLYVGDSSRIIKIYSPLNLNSPLYSSNLGNHNSFVTDIFIGSQNILTCAIDNKLSLWNRKTLKWQHQILDLHKRGILGALIYEGQIITVGGDWIIRFTQIENKTLI